MFWDDSMNVKTIVAFLIWTINVGAFLLLLNIKYKVDDLRGQLEDLEVKVSNMRMWAEDIKSIKMSRADSLGVLEIVENLSKKYGIALESARPSGKYVEVTARGLEPSKTIKFIWELEQFGNINIGKMRLRKNISDGNLNDVEIFIEQK